MPRTTSLTVEQPDNEAMIDFLSFCPAEGVKVEGAVVRATLEYDHTTGKARLHVYAQDSGNAAVLVDMLCPLTVESA